MVLTVCSCTFGIAYARRCLLLSDGSVVLYCSLSRVLRLTQQHWVPHVTSHHLWQTAGHVSYSAGLFVVWLLTRSIDRSITFPFKHTLNHSPNGLTICYIDRQVTLSSFARQARWAAPVASHNGRPPPPGTTAHDSVGGM